MLGSLHGSVDLRARTRRDSGNRLLVDRGDIGERHLRRDAFPANPVPSVHTNTLDRRSRHPRPCLSLEVVRGLTAVGVPQARPAIVRAQTYLSSMDWSTPGRAG